MIHNKLPRQKSVDFTKPLPPDILETLQQLAAASGCQGNEVLQQAFYFWTKTRTRLTEKGKLRTIKM